MAKKQGKEPVAESKQAPEPLDSGRRAFLRKTLFVAGSAAAVGALSSFACRCDDDNVEWSDENKDQQNPFEQGGGGQAQENNQDDNPKKNEPANEPSSKKEKKSESSAQP
jgi:hypothetical protein